MHRWKNITLEMSLKPFKSSKLEDIETVCIEIFKQWSELLEHADEISILLWTSDGSEILDYKGNMDEVFEWAKYIGGANPRMEWNKEQDPKRINLHATYYLYMENPPVFTYRDYRLIINAIKRIGREITGKSIRIGATFDSGPEFAKSDFKYSRHNEICVGESMGKSSMVCCYALLNEDNYSYAGFPEGIPQDTPFGTFFGRQTQVFMTDMGFDYIWLSNGFGFGTETWGMIGAIFDRERFYEDKMETVQEKILEFWTLFRKECNYRVETRGTNMSLGIDLASDAVNLKKIYEGGFDLLPPCNSPWAAINGDYGIELAGYMSRMAELPEEEYIYRFYVHDPWWMNSPWIDRYERQPHDIYLPLSTARINKEGNIKLPTHLAFLTIDNSFGEMPRVCPNEIIPHIMEAMDTIPDASAPLLWVYPFREYNELTAGRVSKAFHEDLFIRGAINHGMPLSMVISTDNFVKTHIDKPDMYQGSILVTPVPIKGDAISDALIHFIEHGGRVLLYGSVEGADEKLLSLLPLKKAKPLIGFMDLESCLDYDKCHDRIYPKQIKVVEVLSDGGMDTIMAENIEKDTEVLVTVRQDEHERVAGLYRASSQWQGGAVIWMRGINGGEFLPGGANLVEYNRNEMFSADNLARLALEKFGYSIIYEKKMQKCKEPVTMISRNKNGFYFSGYCPDTTVKIKFKFPFGAPLLLGSETYLEDGHSVYYQPRAWHKECRVFIEQEDGSVISCKEIAPVSYYMHRRIEVKGLCNSTLRIFPKKGYEDKTEILVNPVGPLVVGEKHEEIRRQTNWGTVIELKGITGTVVISDQHLNFLSDNTTNE